MTVKGNIFGFCGAKSLRKNYNIGKKLMTDSHFISSAQFIISIPNISSVIAFYQEV